MHSFTILSFAALAALTAAAPHSGKHLHLRSVESPKLVVRDLTNGECGGAKGDQCGPGFCCSPYGYCGTSPVYCSVGCQPDFGTCIDNTTTTATTTSTVSSRDADGYLPPWLRHSSSSSTSLSTTRSSTSTSLRGYTSTTSTFGTTTSAAPVSTQTTTSAAPVAPITTSTSSSSSSSSSSSRSSSSSSSSSRSSSSSSTSTRTSTSTSSSSTRTSTSTSTTSTRSTTTTSSAAATTTASSGGLALDIYKLYKGTGSLADGWPAMTAWASFDSMWTANLVYISISCTQFGVPNNSADETAQLKAAIQSVAASSGVDQRFILAIVMQESKGCVRAPTTNGGVRNPGLMQDHNGVGTCNDGSVLNPCPSSQITQMIKDGTQGTASGDGLVQTLAQAGTSDVSKYYRAARIYNSGSIASSGLLQDGVATHCYASDVANRLTGWVTAVSLCNL